MWTRSDEAVCLRFWAAALAAELLLGFLLILGSPQAGSAVDPADACGEIVQALELTSLALGSGAAYTRHPAQADHFAPWGEHPGAFEHFPAGSWMPAEVSAVRREPGEGEGEP